MTDAVRHHQAPSLSQSPANQLSWMGWEAREWVRMKSIVARPPAFPRQVLPTSDVVRQVQGEFATPLGEVDDGMSTYSLRTHTTVGSMPGHTGTLRRRVVFDVSDSDDAGPNMLSVCGEVPPTAPSPSTWLAAVTWRPTRRRWRRGMAIIGTCISLRVVPAPCDCFFASCFLAYGDPYNTR